MTCGAGGMIATGDAGLDRFAREMRLFGRSTTSGEVVREGNDWFLDEFRACVALAQLGEIDTMLARRGAIAERYASALANQPGMRLHDVLKEATHSYYQFPVFLDRRVDAHVPDPREEAAPCPARPAQQRRRVVRPDRRRRQTDERQPRQDGQDLASSLGPRGSSSSGSLAECLAQLTVQMTSGPEQPPTDRGRRDPQETGDRPVRALLEVGQHHHPAPLDR